MTRLRRLNFLTNLSVHPFEALNLLGNLESSSALYLIIFLVTGRPKLSPS